jgi:ubiquinone/menaquinone biosynthesis C-methylase UbiE
MKDLRDELKSENETIRLELKTDIEIVEKQALWAGIKPGMRVADIACGPGKTTLCLHRLVQPAGTTVGLDISEKRIDYAKKEYHQMGIDYICADIRKPLAGLGEFDFVWARFILEYFKSSTFEIVKNLSDIIKPGGILCLIDLDHNSLNHFGLPRKVEKSVKRLIHSLEKSADFDPYIGRKLYSFMYDLDYQQIDVAIAAHHLIFGPLSDIDALNWIKKAELASKISGYLFNEYEGGFNEFQQEFIRSFSDKRRFTYTPIICCRGQKPLETKK